MNTLYSYNIDIDLIDYNGLYSNYHFIKMLDIKSHDIVYIKIYL
jgi:hypothetical protein